MAERRMFAKTIIDSDAFLDMPLSTQALYFHLSMRADDEGFINNPRKIQRMVGASDDDLKLLIAKGFIIPFDSGIVVIKHWRIHNYIQSDRYKETVYTQEKASLRLQKNKTYVLDTECIHDGYNVDTQDRLGKVSIVKDSIEDNSKDNNTNNIYISNDNIKQIYCTEIAPKNKKSSAEKNYSDEIEQIVDYMNLVLGTRYTTKNETNNGYIRARLNEGHTVEDFKTVIDNMHSRWGQDPKMRYYLRPQTLFSGKFEGYLNESEVKKNQGKGAYDELGKRQLANAERHGIKGTQDELPF